MSTPRRHGRPGGQSAARLRSSPPRQAWKYAWGDGSRSGVISGMGSERPAPTGAGAAASERLYQATSGTGNSAREILQREAERRSVMELLGSKPPPNKKSAALASRRFEEGKSKANYGDSLYREGQASMARRDAWRREQERCLQEARAAECTFRPKVTPPPAKGEPSEDFTQRFERMQEEHRQKMAVLADTIRGEAAKEYTFKPTAKNTVSSKLTAGYGDCLTEMKAREQSRDARKAALQMKLEHEAREEERAAVRPRGGRKDRPPVPTGEAVHERLYSQQIAAHQMEEGVDPNCTFRPNMSGTSELWSEASGVQRSRAQLEQLGEALYKDAHNRHLRKQIVQEQVAAELDQMRNAPKVSKKTSRLALQKLEKDVIEIYALLQAEERGLTYQEFGAAAVELGFLRSVDPLPSGAAAPAAKEDALLLQRLWRGLTPAQPDSTLQSSKLVEFLMAALGPARSGVAAWEHRAVEQGAAVQGTVAAAVVNGVEGDMDIGAEAGAAVPERPRALGGFADAALLADFAQLYRNTLSYKHTRNVRESTEIALQMEDSNNTFAPVIDHKSRKLEQFRNGPGRPCEQSRHHQLYEQAPAKHTMLY